MLLHSKSNVSALLLVSLLSFVITIIMTSTTANALSASTTKTNDDITVMLKQNFPHMLSYETRKVITQANAEGQRLLLTLHEDETPYDHEVFCKRVAVKDYIATKKDWADLRRTLLYMRTEVRFYRETLPFLQQAAGLQAAPKVYVAQHDLAQEGWIPDDESGLAPAGAPPDVYERYQKNQDKDLSTIKGSGEIIMDCVNDDDYRQASPVTVDQAKQCLFAVAQMHAAAWQNEKLLSHCAQRLSLASFHLQVRNPKELEGMAASWEHFSTQFAGPLQEAGLTERTKTLGARLKRVAPFLSQQLSPRPSDPYATLVHGDYKAMNVFLPQKPNLPALIVDYASTGIGLGVSDVAMHIHHAVLPGDLANGGEGELLDYYVSELQCMLPDGTIYPNEVALQQYRMAVVDYGRFVLGRFWKAATPETFEKRKDSPNTTLINRNVDAAMAFIDRLERYLSELEEQQTKDKHAGEL